MTTDKPGTSTPAIKRICQGQASHQMTGVELAGGIYTRKPSWPRSI